MTPQRERVMVRMVYGMKLVDLKLVNRLIQLMGFT